MSLSNLPKDVLMLLVLEMDIEYVINLCQTSSIFNNKICKDDHFWLNKLIKEYGIKTELSEAKNEYLNLRNMLKNDPNTILASGIRSENYKMVKKAIEGGADPNIKMDLYYPITLSIFSNNTEILVFLLNTVNKDNIRFIIKNILDKQDSSPGFLKCIFFNNFVSIFIPYAIKSGIMDKEWKTFFVNIINKLKQFNVTNKDCVTDEFYNKWIGFYTDLV